MGEADTAARLRRRGRRWAAAARRVQLYGRFATGYRGGGASSRSLTYRPFGPEEVASYEIGAKTEFVDRHLRLNLAGFIINRTGSQIDFSLVTPQPNGSTRNTRSSMCPSSMLWRVFPTFGESRRRGGAGGAGPSS